MASSVPGLWLSPITSDHVVDGGLRLSDVRLNDGVVYWREERPKEKGRGTVCSFDVVKGKKTPENIVEITPSLNVATRVQEYGGSSYLIGNSTIVLSDKSGELLYGHFGKDSKIDELRRVVSKERKLRFADGFVFEVDPFSMQNALYQFLVNEDGSFVMICEDHTESAPEKVQTSIVRIRPGIGKSNESTKLETLAKGHDFFHSPRWKGRGTSLFAFVAYDHPNMPWDNTSLFLQNLETGVKICVAEGHSIVQVKFSPEGRLFWMDDRTGFWNLYCYDESLKQTSAVFPHKSDMAGPQWKLGQRYWDFIDEDRVVAQLEEKLGVIDIPKIEFKEIDNIPFTSFSQVACDGENLVFIGSSYDIPTTLAVYELRTKNMHCLRKCLSIDLAPIKGYLSKHEVVEFPTSGNRTSFLYYYPPTNKEYDDLRKGNLLPPLIVRSHGGPTSSAGKNLNLRYQFWTSRGFAIADVDYGGSTGYGREYRNRLKAQDQKSYGKWGITDIDDCCKAAEYLIAQRKAHPKQLIITGGSAGGFTTLGCLCFRDTFSCGASYYGVSDLEALARDTHKFESRYLDMIVGPYPAAKKAYQERSAITFPDRFSAPLILFQGLEDKIVPPNQARTMHNALKKKGIYTELIEYKGEAHGFLQAENIKDAIEKEHAFYVKVLLTKKKNESSISATEDLQASIRSIDSSDAEEKAKNMFRTVLPKQLTQVNKIKADSALSAGQKKAQIKAVFEEMHRTIKGLEAFCLSALET